MSTQIDTLRVPSALPEDSFALIARARAMQSAYLRHLVRRAVASVQHRLAHRRTLAAIDDLSPRLLADIGIDATALRAGVIRRADVEQAITASTPNTTAPKTGNAIEPHLRPGFVAEAANTDVRRAA